jgi:Derlin-2/3
MMIFGAAAMIILSYYFTLFAKIKFLGHPLSFMMVYLWGRSPDNINVHMSFLGLFVFTAPYLPWVMLGFSFFLGNPIETDLLGIIVGHIYYFLEFIYPAVANIRGWRLKRILITPSILHKLCGTTPAEMGGIEVSGNIARSFESYRIIFCSTVY